jgi:hypothetical protein
MNRATKTKLTSGTNRADLTIGNACWETPPLVFRQLAEDFGPFDVDLTADARRHLCPVWFGPGSPSGDVDAIAANWAADGRRNGYSNPPYGPFIQSLVARAAFWSTHGFTSTLLLPLRVTKAFKAQILGAASSLLFCDARLTFFEHGIPRLNERQWIDRGRAVADPAVFDSIVVRFAPERCSLQVGIWRVPKHVTADDLLRAVERRKAVA